MARTAAEREEPTQGRHLKEEIHQAMRNTRVYGLTPMACIWCGESVPCGVRFDGETYPLCLGNAECLRYGAISIESASGSIHEGRTRECRRAHVPMK